MNSDGLRIDFAANCQQRYLQCAHENIAKDQKSHILVRKRCPKFQICDKHSHMWMTMWTTALKINL